MKYETVIGLEVHVQLLTETKAFCGCSTKFGLPPNSSTCPVCLGLPGVLPVLNEKAFSYAIRTALALNCEIQNFIKFDRKNYYYPDLPKNFQISQFDKPLAFKGVLEIGDDKIKKKIIITRVHLEEDAGKLIHDTKKGLSYLDLNRAGTPLLEIVTEPDLRSPDEASVFLQSLKAILEYLKVSDCNMEEGSLRCDANISIRPEGESSLGVKIELKNMNSFKAVRDALSFEAERQLELSRKGERLTQETRLWNVDSGVTIPMRKKEESHDYRYFPEPDLIPFVVSREEVAKIKSKLPELPQAKKNRFIQAYSLSDYDAQVLTRDLDMADFFEKAVKAEQSPKEIANWLLGDVSRVLNERKARITGTRLKSEHLAELIRLIKSEEITGKIAKDILTEMVDKGSSPVEIVEKKGLRQIRDSGELESVVLDVIRDNEKSAGDFKKGKTNALMFLVGQVMRRTKGKANPQMVSRILKEKLKNDLD